MASSNIRIECAPAAKVTSTRVSESRLTCAWFRALDQAQVKRDSDTRVEVTFAAGAHSMRMLLDATSIRNPFVRDEITGFHCGIAP